MSRGQIFGAIKLLQAIGLVDTTFCRGLFHRVICTSVHVTACFEKIVKLKSRVLEQKLKTHKYILDTTQSVRPLIVTILRPYYY